MQSYHDQTAEKFTSGAFSRVAKYIIGRAAILLLMVAIGVYLAIVVLNYGGYIDQIARANIDDAINAMSLGMREMSEAERDQAYAQARSALEEACSNPLAS